MSVQEPPWLRRTRPCPFFSQGRCLFADSCNFLHDVKVRSAVTQPLRSIVRDEHPVLLPKSVFKPPSVVVNSASPPSGNLSPPHSPASSVQDSSRYSGLLSVLSDIIGPPPNSPTNADSAVPTPTALSSFHNTTHDRVSLDSFKSTNAAPEMEIEQGAPSCTEPSPIPKPDSEAIVADPPGHRTEPFYPEVDSKLAAEFHPVPDEELSSDGDVTSYFVEATETYVIGSEAEEEGEEDDEDMDSHGEEDPTAMLSNRQSVLSSFTGASLLASPQYSVLGEHSVTSPVADGMADLLSPVQLSAKLRPFSVPSVISKAKRGDSIDSGYADGDNWVSPPAFPRSPPRSFRSPSTSLSHSRRVSISSPVPRQKRVSYDVTALRPRNLIEVIREVESEGNLAEDNEDTTFTILGAYDASPSEGQGGDPLHVNAVDEKVEEDDRPDIPAVLHSLPRYPDHLNPTKEYDLDPSFISDDNLSFKTALSTQHSYENLSDISTVSPRKQDSLLSSISGYSSPNTSIFSHYCDANEHPESQFFGARGQVRSTSFPDTGSLEEWTRREEVAIHSNAQSASATGNDLQGLAPEKPVAPRGYLSALTASAVTSHSLFSAKDVLLDANNLPGVDLEGVIIPQDRSSGVFHSSKQSPKLTPLAVHSRSCSVGDDYPEYAVEDVASTDILCQDGGSPKLNPSPNTHTLSSPGDAKEPAQQNPSSSILHFDGNPKQKSLAGCSRGSSLVNDVFDQGLQDLNGVLGRFPANAASCLESGVSDFFDSERDNAVQCLSFPLPPPFLLPELVGHPSLGGEEGTFFQSEEAATNPEEDASNVYAVLPDEEKGLIPSSSDLTQKARPSRLPPVESPEANVDFTLRRCRAASDITVRARSPLSTVPEDTPNTSNLPSEHPTRFDSVQSLYDQYFDEDTLDDIPESSSHLLKDVTPPGGQGPTRELSREDHPQSLHPAQRVFPRVPSSTSFSEYSNSDTNSSRSETALRPLLTGRTSFLRSSLAKIIPKANLTSDRASSPSSHQPARLQAREIGGTMVPLGFRRHKTQLATTRSSQPFHTVLPTSQFREVLRIRTDVARGGSPPGCSSATYIAYETLSPLPEKAMSAPPTGGLRQLRLSSIVNKRSSMLSTHSSSIASSIVSFDQLFNSSTPQSPSVSSTTSFSHNSSLSPSCTQIPEHMHHTLGRSSPNPLIQKADNHDHFMSHSVSAPAQQQKSWRLSHYRAGSRNYTIADGTRCVSRRTSILSLPYAVDEDEESNGVDATISPIQSKFVEDSTSPATVLAAPVHAIATPKPNLLFAIASDDVDQVRRVLESGEAGPNDSVGPQSALAFTLTNDKLAHKQEIVKALLAYGANPAALRNPTLNPASHVEGEDCSSPPPETTPEGMDPATRYFVARADASHTRQTSQLIYRSLFRPLTRVRYDVIGQDWALEQLFRHLSMHSQRLAVAPIVVLLCGPSGHGKSLLARKFGSLLDVPTHTVNMTTLRSTHDIWQSYSMSPYEEPSSCTLAEFLTENEGKRCVVVLDEIEKVEDQKALWSLLMPWELGRCSLEAGKRHVDARNVIWLGTSNIGHEVVFEHHKNRAEPDERMPREDYVELTAMLRPHVSHCLGASLVSRVTAVLPFVPFTLEEKKAIAAEAVYTLAGDTSRRLSPKDVESLVNKALPSYHPSEGARSLHRAISNLLVDMV